MNVVWVAAGDPQVSVDPEQLKEIGPIWGGQATRRSLHADNVVALDFAEAAELVERGLDKLCNLYVPAPFTGLLTRAATVQPIPSYHIYPQAETVIPTLFSIAGRVADIVLVLGLPAVLPLYEQKLIASVLQANPNTQWVQLDTVTPALGMLTDTTENVLSLLSG